MIDLKKIIKLLLEYIENYFYLGGICIEKYKY